MPDLRRGAESWVNDPPPIPPPTTFYSILLLCSRLAQKTRPRALVPLTCFSHPPGGLAYQAEQRGWSYYLVLPRVCAAPDGPRHWGANNHGVSPGELQQTAYQRRVPFSHDGYFDCSHVTSDSQLLRLSPGRDQPSLHPPPSNLHPPPSTFLTVNRCGCRQDVTNLRKVEGELGRMKMSEQTNRALKER